MASVFGATQVWHARASLVVCPTWHDLWMSVVPAVFWLLGAAPRLPLLCRIDDRPHLQDGTHKKNLKRIATCASS